MFGKQNKPQVQLVTYIIKSAGFVKFGITGNLSARLFAFEIHNPAFEIIGYIEGRYEKQFIAFYKDKYIGREWYKLEDGDLEKLIHHLGDRLKPFSPDPNFKYYKYRLDKQSLKNPK